MSLAAVVVDRRGYTRTFGSPQHKHISGELLSLMASNYYSRKPSALSIYILLKVCGFDDKSKYYIFAIMFNINHMLGFTIYLADDIRLYDAMCARVFSQGRQVSTLLSKCAFTG